MSNRTKTILISLGVLLLLAIILLQIPFVNAAVSWRLEKYAIYAKNIVDPPGPVPTALPVTPVLPTQTSEVSPPTATPQATTPPTATSTPPPAQVSLPSPPY